MRFIQHLIWLLALSLPFDRLYAAESQNLTARIDELIQSRWVEHDVAPANVASDEQFVRRIYLDLAGRIPTPTERQAFLDDQRVDKRAYLIDTLLSCEDHVQHLTDVFDTLLMGRGSERAYRERSQHGWRAWLENAFRENRPWDEMVREILLARPESKADRGVVWFLYERNNDYQKIAEAVAPAFFGIRIECAQCHDHMIATEIEQRHYWGLVAFFNRGKNTKSKIGPQVAESAVGGFSDFANLEGSSSPNLLTFFQAKTVEEVRPNADAKQEDRDELYRPRDNQDIPRIPKFSRREMLVEEIVEGHPLIARSFVNRIWAMLLGRGIVHPFDEMDSMHPPSHPELLNLLTNEFQKSQFNIRELIRAIVLSRVYQLDSRRPDGVEDPASFAWYLERPLTAEQFARSLLLAVRGEFKNDAPLLRQLREPLPDVMSDSVNTDVTEALFLSNGEAINGLISQQLDEKHLMTRLNAISSVRLQIREVYLVIFGRLPAEIETERLVAFLQTSDTNTQDLSRRWQQVIWAMLMSAEFRFNH